MTARSRAASDAELMAHVDGEADGELAGDVALAARVEHDPESRLKAAAIKELGEVVRGHLELSADDVHDAKFAAMWRRIDEQLGEPAGAEARSRAPRGWWARISAWLDHYRGHVITGAVSAGAVAALALVLRPSLPDAGYAGRPREAIDVRPVALRATPEIDALDTPGGSSTVINLDDEDGHTTVIWVTPADTLEGI